MKNFIIILLGLISVSTFFSCEKDANLTMQNQDETSVVSAKVDIIIGFYFTWDDWGRKKYKCNGSGLCNFRIETIEISIGKNAPINKNSKGELFVTIPVDKDLKFEDSMKNLYIDENLFSKGPDDKLYMVPEGVYQINTSIGKFGGYILPIKIVG